MSGVLSGRRGRHARFRRGRPCRLTLELTGEQSILMMKGYLIASPVE
jgi:hypothetical protein